MNLTAAALLPAQPETRVWYRLTDPQFLASALSTAHTVGIPSRFYDPLSASPRFPALYLSDHPLAAQFEAQALFGSPTVPGGTVPGPRNAWVLVAAPVALTAIVDLSDIGAQALLDTSAQELTGNWTGYRQRGGTTAVRAPIGTAPTQALGEAIHRDQRGLEGCLFVSARLAWHRNLVVFPDALRAGSFVQYEWTEPSGTIRRFRVDAATPDGAPV